MTADLERIRAHSRGLSEARLPTAIPYILFGLSVVSTPLTLCNQLYPPLPLDDGAWCKNTRLLTFPHLHSTTEAMHVRGKA